MVNPKPTAANIMSPLAFFGLVAAIAYAGPVTATDNSCTTRTAVGLRHHAEVQIVPDLAVRAINPRFFGFNLEWLEFQLKLWDPERGAVREEAIELLKAFSGAVYRFPGGHNANHLEWHDAVGKVEEHALRKQVTWLPPVRVNFGIDEYFDFLRIVRGKAWYVVNLYGSLERAEPSTKMASAAEALARYIAKTGKDYPKVLRWELGNELDRDRYQWPPDKFVAVASAVSSAIRRVDPAAQFAHLQQEYAAQKDRGISQARYNQIVSQGLAHLDADYTMHFYYDGRPHGPPVRYFLDQICSILMQDQMRDHAPRLWVTEHARIPEGAFEGDWKKKWPGTADLQAAISVADMVVGLAQIPQVEGAFVHALHATGGPWPMMHLLEGEGLVPSAPFLALRILRTAMLPYVLGVRQSSRRSDTTLADYATRAAILSDGEGERLAIWAVNRSADKMPLKFRHPGDYGRLKMVGSETLTGNDLCADNNSSRENLAVVRNAVAVRQSRENEVEVILPPYSVSAIRFSAQKKAGLRGMHVVPSKRDPDRD